MHAMLSDPGSPSGISPSLSAQGKPCKESAIPSCWLPRSLKPSPTALIFVTWLNCLREVRLPYGLHCSLCTLHNYCSSPVPVTSLTPLVVQHSIRVAG